MRWRERHPVHSLAPKNDRAQVTLRRRVTRRVERSLCVSYDSRRIHEGNATLTQREGARLTVLPLCSGEVPATSKRSPGSYRFRPRFQNRHDMHRHRCHCQARIHRSSCGTAQVEKTMQSTIRSRPKRRKILSRTNRLSPADRTPSRTVAWLSRRRSAPGDTRSQAEHATRAAV